MADVKITPELGCFLKEQRTNNKIKAKDIARALKMSPAYISKLESGKIQSIAYDKLMIIFHTIFPDVKTFKNRFEEFINRCSLKLSDEEIKKQVWLQNFDTIFRKIPIPSDLIDYINELLKKTGISVAEVVARVNLNEDIKEYNLDLSKYKKNIAYWENERNIILMDIELGTIEKILNREITECNYATMEAFVYNLFKYTIADFVQAHIKAVEILTHFKFYSIIEKQKKLKETRTPEEIESILTDFDKANRDIRKKIDHYVSEFSTLNIKYTNEKLLALSKSFESDPSLAIAYLGIDISPLKDLSTENKRAFLNDISKLVKQYQTQTPKQSVVLL